MWNEISKLIDPNFKPAPRGARGDSRGRKEEKLHTIKKENSEMKKNLFSKGRSRSSSRDGEKKSFGYKGKSSFGDKSKPSSNGRSEYIIKRWREKKFRLQRKI